MNSTDPQNLPMHAAQDGSVPPPTPAASQPPPAPTAYAQPAAPPAPVSVPDPRSKSPALACFLSIMPGLGQVYVGYYQRGFIHAAVIVTLITILASASSGDELIIPPAMMFMFFFWLYNIIDAGRRASLYNQALAGTESIAPPEDFKMPRFGGSIFGGAVLIFGGLILLTHTRFGASLAWIEEWWPVAPIVLGGWLIWRAIQERAASE